MKILYISEEETSESDDELEPRDDFPELKKSISTPVLTANVISKLSTGNVKGDLQDVFQR